MRYRRRLVSTIVSAVLVIAASSCATSGGSAEAPTDGDRKQREGPSKSRPHTDLDATLWLQSSAERAAHTRQAFRLARLRLEQGLQKSDWTAALEQKRAGEYSEKPPAVIVDVDETVLDNSAYQARLLRDGTSFEIETWNAWCREEKAPAIPGALEFAKYATSKDVTVFYVTNRQHAVEESTRNNLEKLGFPLDEERDVVLTKNEKEGWGSDKTPRRKHVAKQFRILLLVGDNLGDFVGETEVAPEQRSARVEKHSDRWGKYWIVTANPTYGDWESGTYGFDHGLSEPEKLERKLDALEPLRDD